MGILWKLRQIKALLVLGNAGCCASFSVRCCCGVFIFHVYICVFATWVGLFEVCLSESVCPFILALCASVRWWLIRVWSLSISNFNHNMWPQTTEEAVRRESRGRRQRELKKSPFQAIDPNQLINNSSWIYIRFGFSHFYLMSTSPWL